MNCNECKKQLSCYSDQNINEEVMQAIKKHLEECEECREEWQILKNLGSYVKQISVPPMPNDLHEKIMSQVKKEAHKPIQLKKKMKHSRNVYGSMVAALFVGIVGISYFLDGNYSVEYSKIGIVNEANEISQVRTTKNVEDEIGKLQLTDDKSEISMSSITQEDVSNGVEQADENLQEKSARKSEYTSNIATTDVPQMASEASGVNMPKEAASISVVNEVHEELGLPKQVSKSQSAQEAQVETMSHVEVLTTSREAVENFLVQYIEVAKEGYLLETNQSSIIEIGGNIKLEALIEELSKIESVKQVTVLEAGTSDIMLTIVER